MKKGYGAAFTIVMILLCGITPVSAYEFVGGAQNCQQCHTDYTSGSDWHNSHVNSTANDCSKCHDADNKVPTANCNACHSNLPCDWVNNHTAAGNETCITCHADCETNGSACPASACLGAASPQLDTLRNFRDEVLAKSQAGRAIIKAYYRSGTALSAYLDANPALKAFAARVLASFAAVIEPFIAK